MKIAIASEAEMLDFGRAFAAKLCNGEIVAIDGPLGAGKTVFSKGVLEGLGFVGQVTSPTYTLVHHYDPPETSICVDHVDLYRIKSPDEVDELGLFQGDAITLVEWAKLYPRLAGFADYKITIAIEGEGSRSINLVEKN